MILIKQFFSFLSKAVIALACIYGLVFLPSLFNYHPHIIEDDGMSPTYPPSSIVYYSEIDYRNIRNTDIITFKENDEIRCARVINVDKTYFTVRNDNKDNIDQKIIIQDNILGKNSSIMIKFLGAYILFVNSHLNILLPIGGGILLIRFIFIFIEPKEKKELPKKKVLNIEE